MGTKPLVAIRVGCGFESSVILYGYKALLLNLDLQIVFESSVILYGCKAQANRTKSKVSFESSVILYGCKAKKHIQVFERCLRVV